MVEDGTMTGFEPRRVIVKELGEVWSIPTIWEDYRLQNIKVGQNYFLMRFSHVNSVSP